MQNAHVSKTAHYRMISMMKRRTCQSSSHLRQEVPPAPLRFPNLQNRFPFQRHKHVRACEHARVYVRLNPCRPRPPEDASPRPVPGPRSGEGHCNRRAVIPALSQRPSRALQHLIYNPATFQRAGPSRYASNASA